MKDQIDILVERYPMLSECEDSIREAKEILRETYFNRAKLLVCGNGGSAADSEHIVGELMKGFVKRRPLDDDLQNRLISIDSERGEKLAKTLQRPLTAISLCGHVGLSTAFMNDCSSEMVFAQQVLGYAADGDSFLGISTSGNSANVVYAALTAKALGLKVISLTGAAASRLSDLSDVCVRVPETETFKVQELHLPVYHAICLALEDDFFDR